MPDMPPLASLGKSCRNAPAASRTSSRARRASASLGVSVTPSSLPSFSRSAAAQRGQVHCDGLSAQVTKPQCAHEGFSVDDGQ
ncbi:hypothetical protein DFH11DRAFT_1735557 [Phellopilus nigrolimitatus]|nr:hypothetical protein DFH11DRAFT_1735557 [Phellopilus nigrolimitatus]